MFGKKKKKQPYQVPGYTGMVDVPQPTQMAQAAPQANPISFGKKQQPPQFQLPERKGAYGKANMTFIERLVGGAPAVSAALQDNRAQEQQFYQQQQLGSKADQLGLQGRERLAFMVNPEEYTKNLSTNYAAANVAGGDSRYIHGQGMVTAPKMVNNGNQFFTQGANGTQQTGDFGQTYDEQNTAFNNDTTRQNNLATQDLRGSELNETIRNNTMTNDRGVFDNTTSRMDAITNREKAEYQAQNPTSDLGKNPLYMTDENGNLQVGQLGNGQIVRAQTPEGMTLLSPFEKAQQQQQGRSQGKTLGETSANLPAIENNAQRALKTVDQLLTHRGIDAGTGKSAIIPALPGTDKYAFNVANRQAQGQVFLQGFEALKGGGVITEVEGLKAEQALARMDKAQSREDYELGLKDYRDVIKNGMAAAYQKAGQPVPEQYRTKSDSELSQDEMIELEQLRRELGL